MRIIAAVVLALLAGAAVEAQSWRGMGRVAGKVTDVRELRDDH